MSEPDSAVYDEEVLSDELPDSALEVAGCKGWEGPASSFTVSFCSGIDMSFPKIRSHLNWHDEVESLHRQWRCLRSFMHSGCSSPTCSSRVVGLKPRTSFSVIS